MFWRRKPKKPMPVNLNDCVLLWQMGYDVIINDGSIVSVKKRSDFISAIKKALIIGSKSLMESN